MPTRVLGLGVRLAILDDVRDLLRRADRLARAAPTKSDQALIANSPFSFGSFHHVGTRVEAPRRVQQPHLPAVDREHALLRADRDGDHARGRRARRATASRLGGSRAGSSCSR